MSAWMRVCARVCKRERLNLCVKRKERDSVCTPLRNVGERERENKKPRNGGKKKKKRISSRKCKEIFLRIGNAAMQFDLLRPCASLIEVT